MRRVLAIVAVLFALAGPACNRSADDAPDDSAFRQITAVDPDELAAARKRVDELLPRYMRQSCEGSHVTQCFADLEPLFVEVEQAWRRYRTLFLRVDRANQLPPVVDKPLLHTWMNAMDRWIALQREGFDRWNQCLAGRAETDQESRKCLEQLRPLINKDAQLRQELTRLSRRLNELVANPSP